MKTLTHSLAAAVALVTGVAMYPGVSAAAFTFAHDHGKTAALGLAAAVIAALYHDPVQRGGG
jgi:hypothetical protein